MAVSFFNPENLCDTQLDTQLSEGWALPSAWYSDPSIFKLEQERIFKCTWQFAGLASHVAELGTYMTCRSGNIPIVVVRDLSGELRAFVNLCRHRLVEFTEGTGKIHKFQCPYHAWTYQLDGTLRAAPYCHHESGFDKSKLGLIPVKVDSWGPFVFFNLNLDTQPLIEYLGRLPEILTTSGLDLQNLKSQERTEFEISANWKVVAENYLECYHCPMIHPGLDQVINVDPKVYLQEAKGNTLTAEAPLQRYAAKTNAYDLQGTIVNSRFTLLWPNASFNVLPGRSNLIIYSFTPVSAQKTQGVFEYFFSGEVDVEFEQQFKVFIDQLGTEDIPFVEASQRGLESGMVPQGYVMRNNEILVHYFQRLIYQALMN